MPLTSKRALFRPAPPSLSAVARHVGALPLAAPLLVALTVVATETAPPSRQEAETALLLLLATTVLGPPAVAGLCAAAGLPRDLALGAVLLAAAALGLSVDVLSRKLSLPGHRDLAFGHLHARQHEGSPS